MKYLRRFLWYVAKTLLGVTILFGVLIIAFYMAMNTANITILLKDGMALRAQVIMMERNEQELTKYFKQEFVDLDAAINLGLSGQSPYANYAIAGIDHRIKMEWLWCWPWENTARADFVESVPKIDGRVLSSLRVEMEQNNPDRVYPPPWTAARYRATLVRESGRWKISSLKLMETLAQP